MKQPSFMDRARYQFDNYMAQGTPALIGGLALFSFIIVFLAGIVLIGFQIAPAEGPLPDLLEAMWVSMTYTLDAGTVGGANGTGFRVVMFVVTLGGIFVVSALIGVLNNGLEEKMEELRKGRSKVIENDHTVILGWSDQVFSIISELVVANANQARPCIVILGDHDKVEMEEAIRERVGDTGKTRVVCRTGSPIDLGDLEIVSLNTARAILIVAPENDDPDAEVIKTLLAITNNPERRSEPYHIVAEIRDPKNYDVARMVGKDEAEIILVGDLIARIVAQTCRQSGLSVVYTELLDFGGDEIYFKSEPALVGKTFGEALLAYEDSAVIGLRQQKEGVRLNPPMDTPIRAGDQIIAVSQDDDTIKLSGKTDLGIKASAFQLDDPAAPLPERTLILGWNWRATTIINELDNYVAPGSELTVVANVSEAQAEIERLCANPKNQKITYQEGDTTDRRLLDTLQPETYKHIIVLSYSSNLEPQKADAHTLITLLHLRDLSEKRQTTFSIVTEMLDLRNRTLAEVTRADDFIVSDKLVSLMLAQVAENKNLNAVFADIFDPEGSEIYLRPASHYVKLNEPINFYTVVEAARRRGGVAIGYRLRQHANDPKQAYGVVVNPKKSDTITFGERDRIVVIAEN